MKILKLTVENLNSLRGRHEVDFAAPPLSNTGLFAIVGETGAGKTTLLDAITLALYGRIDRDPDKKGAGKEVMSWGTGSCFAEIEFTTTDGTYRSRWERRRAHEKPDGRLQASERAIAKYDPKTGEWPYLETKLSEVDALAPQIIGLDYNRFTRSVMLTQGEFARFLKAKDSERANLLESITGTEIYRELSIAAFERHKEAATELESLEKQIDQLLLLSEAEKAAITEQLTELQTEAANCKKLLERMRAELALYAERAKVELEVTKTKEQVIQATEAIKTQATERAQLAAAERVRPVAIELGSLQELNKRIQTNEAEQSKRKVELAKLVQAEATAVAAAEAALAALNKFEASKKERTDKINQAADLEAAQKGLKEQRQKTATKHFELSKLRLQTEQEQVQLAKQKKELTASLSDIHAELNKRLGGKAPIQEEAQWALLLANKIASTQVEISQQQQLLNALISKAKIGQLGKEVQTLAARINKGKKQLDGLQKEVAAAEKEVVHRQEIIAQLRLNQQLHVHQQALEPGAPCPLCGALEHPLLEGWKPPTDSSIARSEQELVATKTTLADTQKSVQAHENALAKLTGQLDSQQAQLVEQQRVYQENHATTLLPKSANPAEVQKALSIQQTTKDALIDLSNRLQKTEANQVELKSTEKRLEELIKTQADRDTLLAQFTEEVAGLDQNMAQLTAQHTLLLKGNTVAEARQKMITTEAGCRKKEADARQLATQNQAACLAAQTELNALEKSLKTDQEKVKVTTTNLTSQVKKLGFQDLAAAANAMLDSATEQVIRDRITQADQQLHSLTEKLKEQDKKLEELTKKTGQLTPELDLVTALANTEKEQSEREQSIGAARNQLKQDEQNRQRSGALTDQRDTLQKETVRWSRLNELIGQKDGSKFSRFAQGLTLARLVQLANQQLRRLSVRYRIDREAGEDLSLEIIDTYQADNRRPTMTLSGGESFLISLALALGLSDLAGGKTEIRSLFIDEGFGTLDSNSLDIVVTTLENLQASGKTIGLISHVPALRERIHHQIILEPRGDGFSGLRVE